MLNKKLLTTAIAATLLAGATATTVQAGDISANVALTSDYRFRGISQSNENPAIQGGFDYALDNGIYLGTWGSVVDFDSTGDFNGSLELDYYGGWSSDIGENSNIDVGYIYYDYPGDEGNLKGDYQEVYLNFGWHGLSLGAAYSDDYFGESGEFLYLQGGYDFTFGDGWTVSAHAGYNKFDEDVFLSSDKGNYYDYSLGITKELLGVEVALTWVGTDLDEEDVFDSEWAEDTAVLSLSKSF